MIKKYLMLTAGTLITSIGVSIFYLPNKLVTGGVSGISTILAHMLAIPPGLSILLINLILLLISIRLLGKKFAYDSILGIFLVSGFIQLMSYLPPITENIFLAAMFGGILYGIGIGVTFAAGANTGGTDILARILQHRIPHIPIGKFLLFTDSIIILISLFAFGNVELCLFGILGLMVSTYVVDYMIKMLNVSKFAFVITEKGEEIANALIETSPRGITMYNAIGAFSKQNKAVLMCALKSNEIQLFQEKILLIDKDAFVIFSEAQQIVGKGFLVYK